MGDDDGGGGGRRIRRRRRRRRRFRFRLALDGPRAERRRGRRRHHFDAVGELLRAALHRLVVVRRRRLRRMSRYRVLPSFIRVLID